MNDRALPQPAPTDVSTITVLSDGNEISREFQLLTIVVNYAVNRIPTATIVFLDGDVAQQDFPVSNLDDFAPGREIDIQAGYHSQEESIFKGVVLRHGLRSKGQESAVLTVVCKDPAVKMTVGRHSAYFYETTDTDILDGLISDHGLTADLEDMPIEHKQALQYQTSDWDFVVSRAEMNGKLVMVRDGTVAVKAPDTGQEPVIALEYGATIIEFEAELDSENQWTAVKTGGWDHAGQAPVETDGQDPGLTEQGNLASSDLTDIIGLEEYTAHTPAALGEAELQAWSDGLLLRSRLSKICGRVRCQGIALPKVGDMIELAGVGERFNGVAFVSGVRHEITPGNWVTDLEIGLQPKWFHTAPDIRPPLAAGTLPPIEGLHVGIVTKLGEDPDGEHRIQVRLPMVDPSEEGVWARISTLDAGEERGTFFLPEIEDEVVVGFLHGDARQPIVLGMMHSSAKPAPLEASDDNHEKAYYSRSKIIMGFDDDKKIFRIEMPSGSIATLDDDAEEIRLEDASGNVVTLNGDGITLDSPADITISASGDVKISGSNIEASADMEVKANGGASSTLSSDGSTTVKGSLVQIN